MNPGQPFFSQLNDIMPGVSEAQLRINIPAGLLFSAWLSGDHAILKQKSNFTSQYKVILANNLDCFLLTPCGLQKTVSLHVLSA